MRTFGRLRQMLAPNEDLARQVAQHDEEIAILFEPVERLLEPQEEPASKSIGFRARHSDT